MIRLVALVLVAAVCIYLVDPVASRTVIACARTISLAQPYADYVVGPCATSIPLDITVTTSFVSLTVIQSTVNSVAIGTSAMFMIENVALNFTQAIIQGVLPVLSITTFNYTVLLDRCAVSISSPLDLLYLTRAPLNIYVWGSAIRIVQSSIALQATSSGSPVIGLVAFGGTMDDSSIDVVNTTITISWTLSSSTVATGRQSDARVVWLSGGGERVNITIRNVSASLSASADNILVRISTVPVSYVKVGVEQSSVAAVAQGPRGVVSQTDILTVVAREATLVALDVGLFGNDIVVSRCTMVVQLYHLAATQTTMVALLDEMLAMMVRFVGQGSQIAVTSSYFNIVVPRTPGGPMGLAALLGAAVVGVLVLDPASTNRQISFKDVRINVTGTVMEMNVADNAMCSYSRKLSVLGYALTTSNIGGAVIVGLVVAGMAANNVSVVISGSQLNYNPPKFSLCPNAPTSTILLFGFLNVAIALPAANATLAGGLLFGSPDELIMGLLLAMFSDPQFASYMKDLQLPDPMVANAISAKLTAVFVHVGLTTQSIRGLAANSTFLAAIATVMKTQFRSPLFLSVDYVASVAVIPALILQKIEFQYNASIVGPSEIVVEQQTPWAAASPSNVLVPTVALFENVSFEGLSVSATRGRRPSAIIAIQHLPTVMKNTSGFVQLRNVTAPVAWIFQNVAWTTTESAAVVPNPLMRMIYYKAPTVWAPYSTVYGGCVSCNDNDDVTRSQLFGALNTSTGAPHSSDVRLRPCFVSATVTETRTLRYVTKSKPLLETASETKSLRVTPTMPVLVTASRVPTLTIDPNITAPRASYQSQGAFEVLVAAVTWLVPHAFPAAAALQRSLAMQRLAVRCDNIDFHRLESKGSVMLAASVENPFQLRILTSAVSPNFDAVAGAFVGNSILCVTWGVAVSVAVGLWRYLRGKGRGSGSSSAVLQGISAAMLPYSGLLQPTITGAIGLIASSPDCCAGSQIAVGVVVAVLWLIPVVLFGWIVAWYRRIHPPVFRYEQLSVFPTPVNHRITATTRRPLPPVPHTATARIESSAASSLELNKRRAVQLIGGEAIPVPTRRNALLAQLLHPSALSYQPGKHWFYLLQLCAAAGFGAAVGLLWWSASSDDCHAASWSLVGIALVCLMCTIAVRPFVASVALAESLVLDVLSCMVLVVVQLGAYDTAAMLTQIQAVLSLLAVALCCARLVCHNCHIRSQEPEQQLTNTEVQPVWEHSDLSSETSTPPLRLMLLPPDPPLSLRPYVYLEEWHGLKIAAIVHTQVAVCASAKHDFLHGLHHEDYLPPGDSLAVLLAVITRQEQGLLDGF